MSRRYGTLSADDSIEIRLTALEGTGSSGTTVATGTATNELLKKQTDTEVQGSGITATESETIFSNSVIDSTHNLTFSVGLLLLGKIQNFMDYTSATVSRYRHRLFPIVNTGLKANQNCVTVQGFSNTNDVTVGINNDTPLYALDVNGDLNVTGSVLFSANPGTSGQVLTSAGTGANPTWTTPSSGGGGLSVYAYVFLDQGSQTLVNSDFTNSYYQIKYSTVQDYGINNSYVESSGSVTRNQPKESNSGMLSNLTNGTVVSITTPNNEAGGYIINCNVQIAGPLFTTDLRNLHVELYSKTRSVVIRQKMMQRYTNSGTSIPISNLVLGMTHMAYLPANDEIVVRITSASVGDALKSFSMGLAKLHD